MLLNSDAVTGDSLNEVRYSTCVWLFYRSVLFKKFLKFLCTVANSLPLPHNRLFDSFTCTIAWTELVKSCVKLEGFSAVLPGMDGRRLRCLRQICSMLVASDKWRQFVPLSPGALSWHWERRRPHSWRVVSCGTCVHVIFLKCSYIEACENWNMTRLKEIRESDIRIHYLNCVHLAEERDRWRAVVSTVMNLRVL
jgi:hypothetical protein